MLDSWEKVIDNNFISSEMIGTEGAEKVVTIKDIDMAECYDEQTKQKVKKRTVFFEECKPLVLNKTNAKTLKRLFSPNSDNPADCVGHKITLKVEKVKAFGKMTDAIRIKEFSEEKCPECGGIIVPYAGRTVEEVKKMAQEHFGKVMCGKCMQNKAKENK